MTSSSTNRSATIAGDPAREIGDRARGLEVEHRSAGPALGQTGGDVEGETVVRADPFRSIGERGADVVDGLARRRVVGEAIEGAEGRGERHADTWPAGAISQSRDRCGS